MELKVDESDFIGITRIESQYNSMTISNQPGIEVKVDEHIFIEHWKSVEGVEHIQSLTIDYYSSLININILRAFPNVKSLILYGHHITSLEGIEWFKKGEYINISIDNRFRNIAFLSQAQVDNIDLFVERKEDLSAIASCKYVTKLDLYRTMQFDLTTWSGVPLGYIAFKRGRFKELGDTATISSLKEISVLGCRNLERFTGDNSRITYMIIEGSKKLNIRTISSFQNIESLIVNGNSKEMAISEMGELRKLRSLWLINCNVNVDITNLAVQFPSMKEIKISSMSKEEAVELGKLNPDVEVSR